MLIGNQKELLTYLDTLHREYRAGRLEKAELEYQKRLVLKAIRGR